MSGKRQQAIDFFISILKIAQPGNRNIDYYLKELNELTDDQFHSLMVALRDKKVVLPYYASNLTDKDVEIKNAFKCAEKLGIVFHQRLWLTDPVIGVKYLTPHEYKIMDIVVRRQSQHVTKGKSVADSSRFIDNLTGQAAGASRTSRMSLPELMNLDSMGLHHTIEELINVRGGNELGFRVAKRSTINTGQFSLEEIRELNSRPTSTETVKAFLLGQHFDCNL